MKIGIEISCLNQTLRGIGIYTLGLLKMLEGCELKLFKRKKSLFPFSGSAQSLFRSYDGVDLIHFPEPKILYGKRPSVPFVLTIHDVMPLKFPHFFPKKHILMMRHFLPRYLKQADGIICVSQTTRRDLLTFFPQLEAKVIPCSLPKVERQTERKRAPFFLYVGSFERRKNLEGIFRAFEMVRANGLDYQLIIAGKSEGRDQLGKMPDGVEVLGYVTEGEKRDLLERATLLIWPSLYEGFGLPLLEAMASGTPIITSDRGACPETTGDAALIVDPEMPERIADAIVRIVEDRSLRDHLKEKGLRRAEDFSMERVREQLIEFYSSVKCSDIQAM